MYVYNSIEGNLIRQSIVIILLDLYTVFLFCTNTHIKMLISKDITYAELVGFFLSLGVSIVQSGQELHGKERFVADGLMTEGECQKLISLLEVRNHEVYML